ncbi:hypothetical protein [Polynucleobacter asymbioticus]|uniref:hypothetical protein n=1 Tax=Polynucleobacter asymbioticus TaxID=576611 RepID=UPI0008F954F7|nr:hypothetical protein [Polynucleobacter asymbioticus]
MNLDSSQNPSSQEESSEISLLDIVNFLQTAWKKLLLAAIAGAILGLVGWFFAGKYQAELVLDNNGGISLVSWRALQNSLPNLADQMIEEGKVSEANVSTYRQMSDEAWWKKNVMPTYAMTKADSKDLASAAGLESAGTSILGLTVTATALSRELAIERSRVEADFLLKGATYLAIRVMINTMQAQVISADTDLTKKINDTQIELQYQAKRLANLEVLLKRFPNDQKVTSQVVDPKDSGAKYLPISTQIIAANTEINANKEVLERLSDRAQQLVILKAFLAKAAPLMQGNFDGLDLTQKLLEAQGELYSQTKPDDLKSLAYLDGLRSQFLENQVRFTKGLIENTAPTASKKGMIKTVLGGLFGAFVLMLLVLLGQRMWAGIKSESAM